MSKWITMAVAGSVLSGLISAPGWAAPMRPLDGSSRAAQLVFVADDPTPSGVPDKNAPATAPSPSANAEQVGVPQVPPTGHENGAPGNNTQAAEPSAAGGGPIDAPGTAPSRHASDQRHLASADRRFVRVATAAGKAEIEEAKLALERSNNAEVKSFAQMIIDDHGKANDQLQAILTAQPVPEQASFGAGTTDKLRDLNGREFDKVYLKDQVRAHRDAITLFIQEAKSGHDAQLRHFASDTLPVLKKHRKLAKELAVKV